MKDLEKRLSKKALWVIHNTDPITIKEDDFGTYSVHGGGIEAYRQTVEDIEEYFGERWYDDREWFDADSFGADLPENWEAIARGLNEYVRTCPDITPEDTDEVWEAYWSNGIEGIPAPITNDDETEGDNTMKKNEIPVQLSLNNGASYYDLEDLNDESIATEVMEHSDALWNVMDLEVCNFIARELISEDDLDFLKHYLWYAPCDLIIG